MNIKKWIAVLLVTVVIQIFPFVALGEADDEEQRGFSLDNIEITVNGVPVEDLLGAASGMFSDSIEENVGEAINGLNNIFGEFANEMSGDLGEIEKILGSMIEDTWLLNIPAVSYYTSIRSSEYDNALELYNAQLSDNADKGSRVAVDWTAECGNSIVYIYDDGELVSEILESVENGTFAERELIFGLEGFTGSYAVSSVLYFKPSDEPFAMCNMTDLTDEAQFEAYRDYVAGHAVKSYEEQLLYGDNIVTVIFWNEDAEADWLTVVAKEIPTMLE